MTGPNRAFRIDRSYTTGFLADLVRIDSINPAFSEGRSDESAAADYVAQALAALGLEVDRREPAPGRVSVVGRLRGAGRGPALLLYGHLDTVGVEGMADPFGATLESGRLYGRGAYDMKGGVAACLGAIQALVAARTELEGDLLVAAVADEEVASLGMADVLTAYAPETAIVTEPTELELCLAHKGFCWIDVETVGRAAHGSRFEEGIDANLRMGRLLARLDALERELRGRPAHTLVGPPSLHAALLAGGSGESTYAARCRLTVERRTVPGETAAGAVAELRAIVQALSAEEPSFQAAVELRLARDPFETSAERPLVQAVAAAVQATLGRRPPLVGRPYWMDAALLAAAGVDTVVLGPGGHGAHADVEWVDVESVVQVAEILARSAVALGRPGD